VHLGAAELSAGRHQLELDFGEPDLHPGSGGAPGSVGPLVLSTAEAADAQLVRVPAADADHLCGREWDWIEAGG
jgi:hypothetical protein